MANVVALLVSIVQNYRELDRGTNYFRAHILDLWEKYNMDGKVDHLKWIELVLWSTICYRLVNRISTFEAFGCIPQVDDWPKFRSFITKAFNNNTKIFTDAHITGGINPYTRNMEELHMEEGKLIKKVSRDILACCQNRDLQGCFKAVKTIKGAGDFIAWQVVCDLMESQCLKPCTENDWTQLGPGAKGMCAIVVGEIIFQCIC